MRRLVTILGLAVSMTLFGSPADQAGSSTKSQKNAKSKSQGQA